MINSEIIQIADAVAREKEIDKDMLIDSMEQAIQVAARKKYGFEHKIRAEIDRKNGEISLSKEIEVVEDGAEIEEEERFTKIPLSEAKERDAALNVGDVISEPLPPIDLGRVAAQTAKQVIVQKVREIEREKQFEDFKDRVGEIINGVIEKIEHGNVTIRIGNTEAFIPRSSLIRNETFKVNDRIRAYVEDVRREAKGAQIFLSRVHPQFLAKLFTQEVPEIYDGVIEIKGVAREPGSRAKIAVYSTDPNIDPVGSCVGVRGARVQAVINELQGERIDIIPFSADPATFVVNSLAPAEIAKVVLDEENNRIEVVVPEDQLSLAIGRRGQNVRLASQITGWNIDMMSEEVESKRRSEEFNELSKMFMEALDVEEIISHLLAIEGFTSVEEVAYVPIADLVQIEGFDEDVAAALQERAKEYLDTKDKEEKSKLEALAMEEAIASLPNMSPALMITLGENGIKTLDDFANLSRDEFKDIVPDTDLSDDTIDGMIMKAREHWFSDEEGEVEDAEAETSDEASA